MSEEKREVLLEVKNLKKSDLKQKLKESAVKLYEEKETEFPQE